VYQVGLFNDVSSSDYIALNDGMINEQLIEKYMEGSSRGLIYGTVREFIWRCEK
jgi:hypothetical protein